ncbi:MAG TPA: hypothetical protein VLH18_07685, partial [Candidatus Limnocylindrales bacterium]|nr:hypothetical protein [Candidatus Limnocylindrales bacterium]
MMDSGWFFPFGFIALMFFGLLLLTGIVFLVVWAVRSLSGSGSPATGPAPAGTTMKSDEAIAIVRKRFAAGEINKEQYDEIMRTL